MKKTIAIILAAAILMLCGTATAFAGGSKSSFGAYEHVFIIGIDGAGAAFSLCDTPNFDRIFADNAYRYDAITEYVTVSAQNWGSILTGVDYETHGFNNDNTGKNQRGSDSPNNSIFYYTRQAYPEAKLVSFCHWKNINHGIIENDIHVHKVNRATDALVTESITHYFKSGKVPKLMFVQLDNADHAAHTYGGYSDQYYKAIEELDVYLGEIYDAIDAQGLMDNSLFVVVADHGENESGHGGQSKDESSAFVAVAGHSVNHKILNKGVRNRDVAAIALYALGIERPAHFSARVPSDLFGVSREKTVAPNPMETKKRVERAFPYFFIGMANRIADPFDKR